MRLVEGRASDHDGLPLVECGMLGAVAQWCECLHGKAPLAKSLQFLGTGVDAEALALVRYMKGGRSNGQAIAWDRALPDVRGKRLDRGFARALLGPYFEAARPGSLWFQSMMDDVAPDLTDFQSMRQLRELVMVPLEANDRFVDTIEFHFPEKLRNFQHMLLSSLGPVLATTWRNRAKGLFTDAMLHRNAPLRDAPSQVPILSPGNPARLSRAEYRVGLMLSSGMPIEEVKSALQIQDSTLRTHLSNLYAKTNVSNLSELVFLLVSSARQTTSVEPGSVRIA
jgi:DNA-binding CsgD family transcriptional regulator